MLRRELSLRYTDCGSSIFSLYHIDDTIPMIGQYHTYTMDGFASNGSFSAGVLNFNIKEGDDNTLLFSEIVDACSLIKCPVEEGLYFSLKYRHVWPQSISDKDYLISTINIQDQMGHTAFCGKIRYEPFPSPTTIPTPTSSPHLTDNIYFSMMLILMLMGGFICLFYYLFSAWFHSFRKI